eukprot:COSAG05_NODE_17_length_35518_cov_34.728084_30_plen_44_part_00
MALAYAQFNSYDSVCYALALHVSRIPPYILPCVVLRAPKANMQ